ncbi:glycoside hydrolase family 35 protein [Xylariaceae sp. FL0255]|nr:glycoside hydrolase family 35 protein [Xylariaceae sp. FL0255]
MKVPMVLAATVLLSGAHASVYGGDFGMPNTVMRAATNQTLQDIVTWDEQSLFINGERIMIFSGEVHPFRLPVPSLWLDIFQKVKALGFNCVSFYTDWALYEGKPGNFTAEGVFDLKPFFDAASTAGIYLLARPGPYINAESSGGGFPAWVARQRGALRTAAPDFLAATDNYMAGISKMIADAQITNGGPVILYQPENEYTGANTYMPFNDGAYMEYVEQQARKAGIVVPLISNDAAPDGHNAPGTGVGAVDIYGHDGYPLGFDCSNPTSWPTGGLPTNWRQLHLEQSPTTPYSIDEFQGGSFDPWGKITDMGCFHVIGGPGFEACAALLNEEFERVFYKNNYAAGARIMNLYMIYGGTNWGNLGYPEGYTSYDYGAAIKEDRTVAREKYSELKLQATFMTSNPGYLTTTPGNSSTTEYSDSSDITVTPLLGNSTNATSFFIVRHTDYTSTDSTSYTVTLPTSQGKLTIPHINGTLTLIGRDSKMMATDYDVDGVNLLYSTADIFTNQKYDDRTVLILYAGAGEYNEFSIQGSGASVKAIEKGGDFTVSGTNSSSFATVGWTASSDRTILQIGTVDVYLLDRNSAYNYWVTNTGADSPKVIVNGPYLVRSANLSSDTLSIQADFNKSTTVEIIGAPSGISKLTVNGKATVLANSTVPTGNITLSPPTLSIPTLKSLDWKYIDSLPEISSSYDDSAWTVADLVNTNNTVTLQITPRSMYAVDYGYNTGMLVYRGHFNATSDQLQLSTWTQGGTAFASAVWVDDTMIQAFAGDTSSSDFADASISLPSSIQAGTSHVFTVLVDQNGFEEESIGYDTTKEPRGLLGYNLVDTSLPGQPAVPVTWKLTGNLGGEDYVDRARGPLNEGGLWAERQGYHLPDPPSASWNSGSPMDGIDHAGVVLYSALFNLSILSDEWDVPLTFSFPDSGGSSNSSDGGIYRLQLYVNGWQYGKINSNIGPQTDFPVPEGIFDYNGENWVAITMWALNSTGASVPDLELVAGTPVWTGREAVSFVDGGSWSEREGAY